MNELWEKLKPWILRAAQALWAATLRASIQLGSWARANPRQAFVAVSVLSAHIGLLIYSYQHPILSFVDKQPHKTVVHTVRLEQPKKPPPRPAPPQKQPAVVETKPPAKKPPPPKKPVAKKPPPPKPPVVKKEAPPKKPIAKKEPPPKKPTAVVTQAPVDKRRQELLRQLEESIEKIEESPHKYTSEPEPKVVKSVGKLSIDEVAPTQPAPKASAYEDELVGRLQLLLRLPDYGNVRVRLRLARNGTVRGVEILSSESASNRVYVENTLPTLQFPAFGSQFKGEEVHEFLLTLTNDT